jgi:hypothetical protein
MPISPINPQSDTRKSRLALCCTIIVFTEALLGNAAERCLPQRCVATSAVRCSSARHSTARRKHRFPYCCVIAVFTKYLVAPPTNYKHSSYCWARSREEMFIVPIPSYTRYSIVYFLCSFNKTGEYSLQVFSLLCTIWFKMIFKKTSDDKYSDYFSLTSNGFVGN